jgi:hypothetical protein
VAFLTVTAPSIASNAGRSTTADMEGAMETLLGTLAFAMFLGAQLAAVVAVRADASSRKSPASDAIQRDRGAKVIWDSAN